MANSCIFYRFMSFFLGVGMLEKKEIRKLLKPILWDYSIDPCDLYDVAAGIKDEVGGFNREKALVRMLERLSWYDLIRLFGVDDLKSLLEPEIIGKLKSDILRDKYEFARTVLHGETVSASGWSPEYREKIRHTLLSNRWYSTG